MAPRVADYMTRPVIAVRPTDNLAHARNLMLRSGVGRLIVVEEGKPVGIVTKKDFLKIYRNRRLLKKPLDTILVENVMTENPATIEADRSLRDAAEIMLKYNVGGLPVVDEEGFLLGIITRTDMARAYAENYEGRAKVSEYMHVDVPRVRRTHTVIYVAELLEKNLPARVIVVENDRPIGIIAPSDLAFMEPWLRSTGEPRYVKRVRFLDKGRTGAIRYYNIPLAGDIMTPDPLTIRADEDLAVAAGLMLRNNIGSLPVVDEEGRLLGLVSKISIICALRNA